MATIDHKEGYIKGICLITGMEEEKVREYAKDNDPLNIIERPSVIDPTKAQLQKLLTLKEFIGNYNVIRRFGFNEKIKLNSTSIAAKYFDGFLANKKDKEIFVAAFLDNQNQIIETKILSEGTLDQSTIYPREVLKQALASGCSSIIFAHNHPGGTLYASKADKELTQKMVDIFHPLGIKVLDHIIASYNGCHSMAESGDIPEMKYIANYDEIDLDDINEKEKDIYEKEDFELEI
ncbi:JAB domain-containing protein [Xylanivirga thermophila]|uniref:JAB domain-containing protein n=1 Tax=Xylanivirga thermophila TaxID=2496273 RepID=UPI00101DDB20|nr:JAB domain-containing protein [Xylanivirga thermophila]